MKTRQFRLFGQDIVIGKRLFGVGKEDDYFGLMSQYSADSKSFNRLDSYRGLVWKCINLIADSVAAYEPLFFKDTKDIGDHAFLQLLNRPGGIDQKAIPISRGDLLKATISFILLQGDVYWYMAKGQVTGQPREIAILRSDKVGRKLDDNGDIEYFVLHMGAGRKLRIEIDEMLPFVGFNPRDPYTGIGTVEAGSDVIQTDQYSGKFVKNFFRNNAGINGVLELKGEVTKPGFKKFVRAWRAKYEGVDNAGKLAIIRASEAKFTKVGLGLDEINMSDLRKMSIDDILLMFGVPLPLLGKADQTGLGRGNVEALEYIFAKYVIEPKLKRFDEILQFGLERYYGAQAKGIKIGHKNIIPEDKEYALKVREVGVDKWITRNEVREKEGAAPIDGGDQLFVPINQLPINEASSTPPATKKLTLTRTIKVTEPKKIKKDLDYSIEQKETFRLRLMRNQRAYELRYNKTFKPILRDQEKEALTNLEAHAGSMDDAAVVTKATDQKLFDDAAADNIMVNKLMPKLKDLAEQQGALALVFAGDDSTEFRMTAPLETFLQTSTSNMATNFNDETLAKLNKTLAEGIQNGESLGKLKKRVSAVYDDAYGYRSLRLARTETLKASNHATNFAYKQTGYVTGKQWYVNPGADSECAEFDGKTVPLDEPFLKLGESFSFTDDNGEEQTKTNDYDTVEQPPLHPNCRCTIIPVR